MTEHVAAKPSRQAWVFLVRFSLARCSGPDEFLVLTEDVTLQIRKECPDIVWINCYSTFGEYDMVLTVECADSSQIQRAAIIFRSHGHQMVQVMYALPWKESLENL